MFRVLDNNFMWSRTHETRASALTEIRQQREYSARINQSTGPMFLQSKIDGEWQTLERFHE